MLNPGRDPLLPYPRRPRRALRYSELLPFYDEFLRRHWRLVAACIAVALSAAAAYLLVVSPRFTTTASIIVEPRRAQAQRSPMIGEVTLDTMMLESQVELLRTDKLLLGVLRKLGLSQDSEFTSSWAARSSELRLWLLQSLGLRDQKDPTDRLERLALVGFKDALTVRRVGLSYIITVTCRSLSPARATRLANAVADDYVAGQIEAQSIAARRSTEWLQERVSEIGRQAQAAGDAAAAFRARSNLVRSGERLLSDQQLGEISTQLIAAGERVAELRARMDRIGAVAATGAASAAVGDVVASETVTGLRQRYLDLVRQQGTLSARFGTDHPAVAEVAKQMADIERSIGLELARLGESTRSEHEIARAREDSIRASLREAVDQQRSDSLAQVRLGSLEGEAQNYKLLYDNFLQRYAESVQQQSFPLTDARIVSPAYPPLNKSSPQTVFVLASALIGGTVLGLALGAAGDLRDRGPGSKDELDTELGITPLGALPSLPDGSTAADRFREAQRFPGSGFAEGVRALRFALETDRREATVLGVVSSEPGEGRTTLAANLAETFGRSGVRAVLVDADLRSPGLSRVLAPGAERGLADVLSGRAKVADLLVQPEGSHLVLLPTTEPMGELDAAETLASDAFARLLAELRAEWDVVLLDLGPLARLVDSLAAGRTVSQFLFVTGRHAVPFATLRRRLRDVPAVRERLVGGVLNDAVSRTPRRLRVRLG